VHRFSCIIVSFLLVRIDGQEGPSLASRTGSPGYGGTVFRDFYLAEPEDRGRATKGFEEHVREVKERVPPERLLIYEVRGAGALCAPSWASRRRRGSGSPTSTRASSSPG
jgi:hypothetical protein